MTAVLLLAYTVWGNAVGTLVSDPCPGTWGRGLTPVSQAATTHVPAAYALSAKLVIIYKLRIHTLFIFRKLCGACRIMRWKICVHSVHCTGEALALFKSFIAEIIYVLKRTYMGERCVFFRGYIISYIVRGCIAAGKITHIGGIRYPV